MRFIRHNRWNLSSHLVIIQVITDEEDLVMMCLSKGAEDLVMMCLSKGAEALHITYHRYITVPYAWIIEEGVCP